MSPAIPSPNRRPTSARIAVAVSSPARAASVTAAPVTADASMPASRAIAPDGSRPAASRPSRSIARPDATCSQHPRFPHPHRGPPGSTITWPISAAKPFVPRRSSPPTMIPPPMPVPTVTTSTSLAPRPAPNRNSPHAAALASFSTTVGRPTTSWMRAASGRSRHATFGEKCSTPFRSASPEAPTPTATASGCS